MRLVVVVMAPGVVPRSGRVGSGRGGSCDEGRRGSG